MVVFPKSPNHPVSLTRIRWFNERDSTILTNYGPPNRPLSG